MYRKVICSIGVALVVISVASAARVDWTGAAGDKRWDNPANWSGNRVPGINDEVYVDVPAAAPPNGPVIQDGMTARVLGLGCEVPGEPAMAMTGGTLEVADWIWWGDGEGSFGTFEMSGGTITVADEWELGWGGGKGIWIMTGGTVTARELIVPTDTGAGGELYLHGGTVNVGSAGLEMNAGGLIDFGGGTMILEGDMVGSVQGFIDAGQITAYAGDGYFEMDYDQRNPAMTTVTAAPLTGKAYRPDPADGAENVMMPLLRWGAGKNAVFHDVFLGTSPETLEPAGRHQQAVYYHQAGLEPGTTYYWRVDEVEGDMTTIHTGDVWSFTMAPVTAYDPQPWDGAKWVDPAVELAWSAGNGANTHDVYFSTDQTAVASRDPAAHLGTVVATSSVPGQLSENTTYYWAVDETQADDTVHLGEVWRFTTLGPGGGVKAEYFSGIDLAGAPVLVQMEDAIDHSWGNGEVAAGASDKVSARWTGELEAPLTETFTLITTSDDGVRLWLDGRLLIDNWTNHGAADDRAPVDLIAGQVYALRMEYYENDASAVARLWWRSPTIPRQIIPAGPLQPSTRATTPYPANQAADVADTLRLRWAASAAAAGHQVYFGDDAEAVANADTSSTGIYRGQQALDATTYDTGPLQWNKTYYWRIDEVNAASADSPWKGSVWNFTTAGFVVVDDFERYTNDSPDRVFQTWVDGLGFSADEHYPDGDPGNGSGATVGNDIWSEGSPHYGKTIIETTLVHGGRQSMPINYNNAEAPHYSVAIGTWPTPDDWTVNGVNTLVLYIRGLPINTPDPVYVAVEDGVGRLAVVVHPQADAATSVEWLEWSIPLADLTAAGVDVAEVKRMHIGTGDPDNPTPGGDGTLYVDDIRVIETTP